MEGAIIIVGDEADAQVEEVRARLRERGAEVLLWDTGTCPTNHMISLARDRDATPACVWVRALGLTALSRARAEAELRERPFSLLEQLLEHRSLLRSSLRILEDRGVPVLNPVAALGVEALIPWQLERLRAAGVPTVATLATNDPAAARAFADRHERVLWRPLAGDGLARSLAREGPQREATLARFAAHPGMLHAQPDGARTRLYVLAGEVIAAGRFQGDASTRPWIHDIARVDAPAPALQRAAARAAACLELVFAGVDAYVDDDGFAFAALDPSPPFVEFDALAGTEVGATLARHLAGYTRA